MHDIKFLIENQDLIKKKLKERNVDLVVIDEIFQLNKKRKELITFVESKQANIKSISKEIGQLKKSGKDATDLMKEVTTIKKDIGDSQKNLEEIQKKLQVTLSEIPNLLDDSVPLGLDDSDNLEVHSWGTIPKLNFNPKHHADLGEELDMLDFERGAKLTGARFVVYKNQLARMERALINFMLDFHTNNGYEEIIPPFIVNKETMYGTGQLPKFEDDLFKISNGNGADDWYLIPTAEVPLTNLKRDELFNESELPFKYCSFTPCFRSEAGSHGKDTRGLIRVHQFFKVEMVNIVAKESAEKSHTEMVNAAKKLLELLELPYRVCLLCAGDTGFSAKKCFDLEVWLPSFNTYREISSVSNCGDFQARRANIRYRDKSGKPHFAYTLNGSGLAVGRTLVAIMENYQQEDGSILVPTILIPYMGGLKKIEKK